MDESRRKIKALKEEINRRQESLVCSLFSLTNYGECVLEYCRQTLNIDIEHAPSLEEFHAFLTCQATFDIKDELTTACIDVDCLYTEFFHDTFQIIWKYLCRVNNASECGIRRSIAEGLMFDNKEFFEVNEDFACVFNELEAFAMFVKDERNKQKLTPEFLVTHDLSEIKISIWPDLSLLKKYQGMKSNNVCCASGSQYESYGQKDSIDVVTTPEELLSFLKSASVDNDGQLVMEMKDHIIFLNCPYTAKRVHEKLCR